MANRNEPWEDEKYLNPPRGSTDRWEVRGNSDWMVRRHSKPRLTSFHPLHKNCPAEDLGSERVTVKFMDGKRTVEKDEWRTSPEKEQAKWTGFTFLKVKRKTPREQPTSSSSTSAPTTSLMRPTASEERVNQGYRKGSITEKGIQATNTKVILGVNPQGEDEWDPVEMPPDDRRIQEEASHQMDYEVQELYENWEEHRPEGMCPEEWEDQYMELSHLRSEVNGFLKYEKEIFGDHGEDKEKDVEAVPNDRKVRKEGMRAMMPTSTARLRCLRVPYTPKAAPPTPALSTSTSLPTSEMDTMEGINQTSEQGHVKNEKILLPRGGDVLPLKDHGEEKQLPHTLNLTGGGGGYKGGQRPRRDRDRSRDRDGSSQDRESRKGRGKSPGKGDGKNHGKGDGKTKWSTKGTITSESTVSFTAKGGIRHGPVHTTVQERISA